MKMSRLERRAHALRNAGMSYRAIDAVMKLPRGKSWIIINRARHRANSRESVSRYAARGHVALVDMK